MATKIAPYYERIDMQSVAESIRAAWRDSTYDGRAFLDPEEEGLDYKRTSDYRHKYMQFKYAVARVFQPRRIVEVGVGSGCSAMAFAAACEDADIDTEYIGIDDGTWEKRLGQPFLERVSAKLASVRMRHRIERVSSQALNRFPECDLVHIDGDHHISAARHDFTAAWRSNPLWILVDDAADPAVAAGVFEALKLNLDRGRVDYCYFADTWSGDLLLRTDHDRLSVSS